MNNAGRHLLVYISSQPQPTDRVVRFEVERQCALMGALSCGLVWDDEQVEYDWNLVRTQIEQADAFLALISTSYGLIAETGIGLQHRELVHALSLNKPIYALVHNADPQGDTEDRRRLVGFKQFISSQVPNKVWHLRDELSVHVSNLVQSWTSKGFARWSTNNYNAARSNTNSLIQAPSTHSLAMAGSSRALKGGPSREKRALMIQANVYRGGSLFRQVVKLPLQTNELWHDLLPLLRVGATEDRLREQVEHQISDSVSQVLLREHPGSHAVDGVRVERNQFRQLMSDWRTEGVVSDVREGARTRWKLV